MALIVLATIGTWGDIFPAVGLAKGLSDAGHTVRIAAPPSYRELVEGEGLQFGAIGPPLGFAEYSTDPRILSGRMGGFSGFLHLYRRFIFPNLDRYIADLIGIIGDADLTLAHPGLIAAPVAAEATQVRWGTISVFPGLIPTAFEPPVPTRFPFPPGAAGRAMHRAAWMAARLNMRRLFDPPVNHARRRAGLPLATDTFFAPIDRGGPYLILASPSVVDRPQDWPEQVQLTGFVSWDSPRTLERPRELADFLSNPDPPVLITLGASSSLDPQTFYHHAANAVTQLGHRAIVLTGPTPKPIDVSHTDRVFSTPFAPLSLVAPRCRAAIHHGGVGTSVALLEAGLSQVVVPRGLDQPQTAVRLRRLGVARSVPWRAASVRRIRRELDALLGDGSYGRNADRIGRQLATEGGLGSSIDAVNAALK